MLRIRRYRVFLVFAFIAVVALYKFGTSGAAWRDAASSAAGAAGFRSDGENKAEADTKPRPAVAYETQSLRLDIPAATRPPALQTPPPVKQLPARSSSVSTSPSPAATKSDDKPSIPSQIQPQRYGKPINGAIPDDGLDSSSAGIPPIHWSKLPEQFPVPSKSLIPLPTGKPKPIPKIQFDFKPESAAAKTDRLAKLAMIKAVAKKSWDGYKQFAWLHDELKPMSGTYRDPFAHWGATLVDSLDTLWIMGLKEDFEEAVKAVDQIDFTTTKRPDIPLFETTIRYLGGLVAAYDISGKKYKSLLDKAVELAEILISAFDTPNRMPQLYYYWRPQFASQSHRASLNAVLAEVGSLSMEFTRLAQLTGEEKYYDAIARITDNLEEFQMKSNLPGMWPTSLDISGCSKLSTNPLSQAPLTPPQGYLSHGLNEDAAAAAAAAPTATESLSPDGKKFIPLDLPEPVVLANDDVPTKADPGLNGAAKGRIQNWEGKPLEDDKRYIPLDLPEPVLITSDDVPVADMAKSRVAAKGHINNWDASHDVSVGGTTASKRAEERHVSDATKDSMERRQLNVDLGSPPTAVLDAEDVSSGEASSAAAAKPTLPECVAQGFQAPLGYSREKYTLGGESDSTYEYLPKEYLLLGGQVEKYRTMYEASADVVKKHLVFRPMLPDAEDILFSGMLSVPSSDKTKAGDLTGENAHLTCFAGGMLGMGAKIFERPEDLEIAKKLTEGCVWSYDMTASGIMPESFEVIPCEDAKHCPWNQTAYWEHLDPSHEYRKTSYETQLKVYKSNLASASAQYEAELAAMTAAPVPSPAAVFDAQATPLTTIWADTLDRRQLPDLVDDSEIAHMPSPPPALHQDRNSVMGGESEEGEGPPTKVQSADIPELAPHPSVTLPQFPLLFSPYPPVSHKDYVMSRIQEERLPPGVTRISGRSYILRPEAIESVWYMYRITGSPHWREAGWRMFEAINTHTSTEYGNSAIDDITKLVPTLNDEMESFWLAETLKYFYLLFEEEDVVSLDEWVLNTEAHPFRRPE
ncbi:glycoside hydrolase family 47 protein [Plenodomus tracheiphilus IPT5]|uniref:alpha-1,2-Mannosidase n=1 Tax=Plenodomus tracheiphilus IPT5 TaxID=1408161 RepID=A0A6A7B9Y9_9PLEO|nr:glycoside hydrolase family 47 protein [Plenodomus tracheiphilus IPT5]